MSLKFKISKPILVFVAIFFAVILTGCESKNKERIFSGYIEGDYLYLAPSLGGRITKINVKEGSFISANTLVFELDDTLAKAELNAAKANLQSLKAQLDDISVGKRPEEIELIKAELNQAESILWIAKTSYERTKALKDKNAVSQKEFDNAQAEFNRAKALVEQLKASLKVAKLPARENQIKSLEAKIQEANSQIDALTWRLDQNRVSSPKDGLVEKIFYEAGEFVTAGQPAISLLPPENLKARFFVPSNEISSLQVGRKIDISCDSCENFSGVISQIASEPEYAPPIIYSQNTQTTLIYRVEAVINEPSRFMHPSLPINVRLVK